MIDPGPHTRLHRFSHDAMACTFGVGIVADDARYAQQAAAAAFREVDALERLLSRFIPHSDIARINALRVGAATRVSPETVACLEIAARVHAQTGGAFDIAFRGRANLPPDTPPLVFDPDTLAVGVQVEDLSLDLGGVGKGYALDRIASVLAEWSIAAAVVHAGQSTAFALGRPAADRPWRIGLRDPADHERVLGAAVLEDRALSGSGQALHGSHIVDPRSGRPAPAARVAWAVAPTAAEADAFSTAFMLLARPAIEALCRQRGDLSAILPNDSGRPSRLACIGLDVLAPAGDTP